MPFFISKQAVDCPAYKRSMLLLMKVHARNNIAKYLLRLSVSYEQISLSETRNSTLLLFVCENKSMDASTLEIEFNITKNT